MRSVAQILASRENGKKSKGPITEAGKAIASKNSVKHGVTAQSVCLDNEDPGIWQSFYQSFLDLHKPANQPEHELVLQMATAQWRLRRAVSADTSMIDIQMKLRGSVVDILWDAADERLRQADAINTLFNCCKSLRNLQAYASSIERSYIRALNSLRALRHDATLSPEGDPGPYPVPTQDIIAKRQPEENSKNEPKPYTALHSPPAPDSLLRAPSPPPRL